MAIRAVSYVVEKCRYIVHIQTEQHKKTSPPRATSAFMTKYVDVATCKNTWNIQQSRKEDVVFTRYDQKSKIITF